MIVVLTLSLGASANHQDYVRDSQCRVLRMFIPNVLCGERNEVKTATTKPTKTKASNPASTASPATVTTAPSVAPSSVNPPQAPTQPTQASVTSSIPANAYATHRIMPPVVPPSFSGGNSSGKPSAGISVDHRDSTQNNPQASQNNISGQTQQASSANQQQSQQGQQGQASSNNQGNDKGNQGKHTGQNK